MVTIQLELSEAQRLLAVLKGGDPERLREIHRTESPEYRARLEREARVIQAVEEKLESALARASDPPAW